jgi:hypothetical protein
MMALSSYQVFNKTKTLTAFGRLVNSTMIKKVMKKFLSKINEENFKMKFGWLLFSRPEIDITKEFRKEIIDIYKDDQGDLRDLCDIDLALWNQSLNIE